MHSNNPDNHVQIGTKRIPSRNRKKILNYKMSNLNLRVINNVDSNGRYQAHHPTKVTRLLKQKGNDSKSDTCGNLSRGNTFCTKICLNFYQQYMHTHSIYIRIYLEFFVKNNMTKLLREYKKLRNRKFDHVILKNFKEPILHRQ